MKENRKYRYWLCCIREIGNKTKRMLVNYCGSAKEIYDLKREQLLNIKGIKEKEADLIIEGKCSWDLEKEADHLSGLGISMVTIEDEIFPSRLLELPDCPYGLFYIGKLPETEERLAAVVGARRCSSYGKNVAEQLGRRFASAGIGVVSGMAAGIDSFGHWGAIHGNGKTYAILGCGIDICYPQGAKELYHKIAEQGAVISEYPPGREPVAWQFPARNRLISAFCDIIIVVEAKKRSGSLITADFALEQGKEIYAVPGRLDDALSYGCNRLIAQGAGIVTSIDDLFLELGITDCLDGRQSEKRKNLLEKEELLVYSCFDLHTKNIEELVQMTDLPAAKVADILMRLCSAGWIEESFKNYYSKK